MCLRKSRGERWSEIIGDTLETPPPRVSEIKKTEKLRERWSEGWSEIIGDTVDSSCACLRVKQTEKIVRKMEQNDWRHWRFFYVCLRERRRERWSEMIGDNWRPSCPCLRVKQTEKIVRKDGAK